MEIINAFVILSLLTRDQGRNITSRSTVKGIVSHGPRLKAISNDDDESMWFLFFQDDVWQNQFDINLSSDAFILQKFRQIYWSQLN